MPLSTLIWRELVVRRDSARTVLTTVMNAGGPRRAASASHVCHQKNAWYAHVHCSIDVYVEYRSVAVWGTIGDWAGSVWDATITE